MKVDRVMLSLFDLFWQVSKCWILMSHHTKLLLALENCSPWGCVPLAMSFWYRCRCLKMENNLRSSHPPPVSHILLVQGHISWIVFSTPEHFKPWLFTPSQRNAIKNYRVRVLCGHFPFSQSSFLSSRVLLWTQYKMNSFCGFECVLCIWTTSRLHSV